MQQQTNYFTQKVQSTVHAASTDRDGGHRKSKDLTMIDPRLKYT